MTRSRRCVTCFVAVLLSTSMAWAATEAEIEAARLKGIEYLKKQQQADGSWELPNYRAGITALCTLALIENGLPISDKTVDKGYRFIRKQAPDVRNTYEVALSIVLLARVGDRQDRNNIRSLGARLLGGQNKGGGWSYNCPLTDTSVFGNLSRLERQDGVGDNSCTQFAVLGLWVASRYGVPIDTAMGEIATRFLDGQNDDGGWAYAPAAGDKKVGSAPAMSCAGLFSLTVARATKIRTAQREREKTAAAREQRGEKASLLADPNYAKGYQLIGTFAGQMGAGSPKYLLWSMERLGVLLGVEKFGDADWFAKGTDALLQTQRPDGNWSEGKDALSDTSFAILFLRKANLGSDISRLLEGEPDRVIVIANRTDQPRFDSVQDAIAAAAAGDVIRLDANGPFKFSHDVLDKDLTIQSGPGYAPVFELQIGQNKLGLRLRPDKDVDSRHMLKVTGGTVTLEGLKLQIDPPVSSMPLPWKAILVTGGKLRLLNCDITESNRRGAAAVTLDGPAELYVRNSLLAASRAGIEAVGAGARQSVTIENSIVFSAACVLAANSPETKQPGDLAVQVVHSCLQGIEAFAAPNYRGTLAIDSAESLYRCDGLAVSLLPSANNKDGRSWKGVRNVYNVGNNWVGSSGKKLATVNDLKSFTAFWGSEAEVEPSTKIIAWTTTRKNTAFAHTLSPQDWDLGEKGELSLSAVPYGILAQTVGAGEGYSRYREDFRYNEWKRGISQPPPLTGDAQ